MSVTGYCSTHACPRIRVCGDSFCLVERAWSLIGRRVHDLLVTDSPWLIFDNGKCLPSGRTIIPFDTFQGANLLLDAYAGAYLFGVDPPSGSVAPERSDIMLILHRIDPDRNMRRWYAVGVQQTLFHRFAVVCGWGRLGTDYARWRIIPAASHGEAEQIAQAILEKKRKRGYVADRRPKPEDPHLITEH